MSKPVARCWCVGRAGQRAAFVLDGQAAGEGQVVDELARHARQAVGGVVLGPGADDARPLVVELHQALGRGAPLAGVAVQQGWVGAAGQHRDQLPAQVEGVAHRHVHALAGLGAVRVAGVAGQHHARRAGGHLVLGHVVELVGQAVADLVDRPPDHLLHVEREGAEDALGLGDDVLGAHAAVGDALVLAQAGRARRTGAPGGRPRAAAPSGCPRPASARRTSCASRGSR